MEQKQFRLKVIEGRHSGEYFASYDAGKDDLSFSRDPREALVMTDISANMIGLYDKGIKSVPEESN